jgi:butyrate kinase
MSVAVNGQVDAILLTGGIAYSEYIISEITKRVSFISKVKIFPGENELEALAMGALRVLRGEEEARVYI